MRPWHIVVLGMLLVTVLVIVLIYRKIRNDFRR